MNAVASLSRVAALLLSLAPCAGAEPARTTLVLDASGSMWGQIDGVAKITIAQGAVKTLLGALPEDLALGLTVYGHRRKGDCGDIEELIAPAPGSRAAIAEAVDGLSPKGKTPLSAAVLQAADGLRHTEEAATVILVSDGTETCDLDPCAVGRALEESGVDFTLHAIGFAIADRETRAQLQCLARLTGGSYRAAEDAESLAAALTEVAVTPPAEPEPQPAPEPAREPASAALSLPATARAGDPLPVQWEGPAEEGDWVGAVVPGEGPGEFASRIGIEHGNPAPLPAPITAGRYEVIYTRALTGEVLAREPLEVTPVGATLSAPDAARTGGTVPVQWTGRGSESDFIGIAPLAEGFPATSFYFETVGETVQPLQMPSMPGAYEIVYIATTDPWEVLARRPITLRDPELTLSAPDTVPAGGEIAVLWTGFPPNPADYIAVAKAGDALPHLVHYAHTESQMVRLPAPEAPGRYELRFFYANGDRIVAQRDITVE